jgi:hypothetical protein
VSISTDSGQTFSIPHVIAAGSGTTNYLDKPWLYVNPYNNHIYVAWVKRVNLYNATTEQMTIWFSRSTDGGANWSSPLKVSAFSTETGTNRSHGPQIAAVSSNHVYISWHTLEAGDPVTSPYRIWIAESLNDGASFGTNYLAATTQYGFPTRFISMGVNQLTGRVFICYADSPVSSPRNYDVYVVTASAASGTWSSPTRVHSNTTNWQFWPALGVSQNGRVDVAWYDQSATANKSQLFYSSSTNGGTSWSTPVRLSSPSTGFDWPNDNGGGTFAGDYLTVASKDEKAVVVWMDNRDETAYADRQEIYMESHLSGVSVPLLISPSDGLITEDNLPTFTWSGTASYYTLQIATDPGFSQLVSEVSPIYGTQYTLTSPLGFSNYDYQPGGGGYHDPHYYWRVQAHHPSSVIGHSSLSRFIIDGPHEVPSEFATISAARAAFPTYIGGTVLVAPGTYTGTGNCNVSMGGEKPVNVIATGGPEVTIIDCEHINYGFYFDLYTAGSPVVDGFTIRNAAGSGDMEGAFVCWTGSATIRNCIIDGGDSPAIKAFRGGRATARNTIIKNGDEGVIITSGGRVTMVGCEVYNNYGWGIEAHDRDGGVAYSLSVDSCLFRDNSQGDILIWGVNDVTISNTTIVPAARGIMFHGGADSTVVTNTIVAFAPYDVGVQWNNTYNTVVFSCCDFYGNAGGDWVGRATSQLGLRGNISEDPLFCDSASNDFRIATTSPCTLANSGCGGMGALETCQGYTPEGNNVAVSASDEVTVTFGTVSSGGVTTVELVNPGSTSTPPDFSIQPSSSPVLYQVNTTATVSGTIIICFEYDPALVSGPEESLRLLHSDGTIPITWDDITVLPVDVTNNVICGTPPTLSPFIVGFWCCGRFLPMPYTGNVDCSSDGKRNLADITRLIDRVYISKNELCCEENGNVDGDAEGKKNLADITRLIDHVYISKAETAACE